MKNPFNLHALQQRHHNQKQRQKNKEKEDRISSPMQGENHSIKHSHFQIPSNKTSCISRHDSMHLLVLLFVIENNFTRLEQLYGKLLTCKVLNSQAYISNNNICHAKIRMTVINQISKSTYLMQNRILAMLEKTSELPAPTQSTKPTWKYRPEN